MKKEIVINKRKIENVSKTLLVSFIISLTIMLLITIVFGKFLNSPRSSYDLMYTNSLLEQYRYLEVSYGTRLSNISFWEKLFKSYMPFIFVQNIKLLLIITSISAVLIQLNKIFSVKIK